jgi:pimeloyl-ACP methyl ester carboxylesterase
VDGTVRTTHTLILATVLAIAAPGCVANRQQVCCAPVVVPPACGMVLVADGAGGFLGASAAFKEAVQDEGRPLAVEPVRWSHGYGRILADVRDRCHSLEQGRKLAAHVLTLRHNRPDLEVYLVGYSAGSAVTLAALDTLPPDSVDRVILILPAVSACYDLRPALRASRQGVDVFHSERDFWHLGVGTALFGTADGRRGEPAAGRGGFTPVVQTPEDGALHNKLRQYPWDPMVRWTGNEGRHGDVLSPKYLRVYVLPLLEAPKAGPLPGGPPEIVARLQHLR